MERVLTEISRLKYEDDTIFDVVLKVVDGVTQLILLNRITGREVTSKHYDSFSKFTLLDVIGRYIRLINLEPREHIHIEQLLYAYYEMEVRNVKKV